MLGISLFIAFCTACGGFCFIAGTMGFIPKKYVECEQGGLKGLEMIGCSFYLLGSILYSIASLLSICRLRMKTMLDMEHDASLQTVSSLQEKVLQVRKSAEVT